MMIKNVDLMKGNPAAPYDLQARQMTLAQQQAIAQALLAQSMENSSPIVKTGGGNPFARDIPNFGDPIARVVAAMMGKKQLGEANEGMNELNLETQRRSQQEMGDILGARFGRMQAPLLSNDDEGNRNPPIQGKGSTIRALQLASQATTPAGKAMFADLNKGLLSTEEAYKGIHNLDPATVAEALQTQELGGIKPKVETKEYEGAARPYQGGVPVGPATPINTFDPMSKNEVGVITQKSPITGKETAVGPQGDISTQKTFDNADSTKQMEMIVEGSKQYSTNQTNLGTIAQVRNDMQAIPESEFGFAGPLKTTVAKAAEALGFTGLTSTSSKEAITAALGNLNLQKVRALAPVTQQDVDTIKEIIGSQGMTKRALERVLGILEAATHADMERYVRQVDKVAEKSSNPTQFRQAWVPEYHPTVVPNAPSANPYKDMNDADIMKRLRGG